MAEGLQGAETTPPVPQVTITVRHNGSYLVEGPVRLLDADGNEYPLVPGKRFSLCRCGGSTNKPFCDGTHTKIGFAAAERAVREADEGGPTPGGAGASGAPSTGGPSGAARPTGAA
jgi:CDGSH-type Zn-finger protein